MNTYKTKALVGIVLLVVAFVGLTGLIFMVPMDVTPEPNPTAVAEFTEQGDQVVIQTQQVKHTDEFKVQLEYEDKPTEIITSQKRVLTVDKADSIAVFGVNDDKVNLVQTYGYT